MAKSVANKSFLAEIGMNLLVDIFIDEIDKVDHPKESDRIQAAHKSPPTFGIGSRKKAHVCAAITSLPFLRCNISVGYFAVKEDEAEAEFGNR
jgi:hypothetical protein